MITGAKADGGCRERRATGGRWLLLGLLVALPVTPPFFWGVQAKHLLLVMASLVLGVVAVRSGARGGSRGAALSPATVGLLLYAVATFLAIPGSRILGTALFNCLVPLAMLALHGATLRLVRGEADLRRALLPVLAALAGIAVFGLADYVGFQQDLASGEASEKMRSFRLATPFFQHSYLAAQTIVPLLPAAVGLLLFGGSRSARIAALVLLAPVVAYLLAILSRGSIVTTGCGLVVVLGLAAWRRLRVREDPGEPHSRGSLVVALVAVTGLVILASRQLPGSVSEDIAGRFASLLDPQQRSFNFSRLQVWEDSARMAADATPFGVGPGQFPLEFPRYYEGQGYIAHAHNQFVHTLVETGPLGLLGLVLTLVYSLTIACRAVGRTRGGAGWLGGVVGLAGSMATLGVYFMMESPLTVMPVAALFAVGSAALVRLTEPPLDGAEARQELGGDGLQRFQGHALVLLGCGLVLAVLVCGRDLVAGWFGYRALQAVEDGRVAQAEALARRAEQVAGYLSWPLAVRARAQSLLGDLTGALETCRRHEVLAPAVPEMLYGYASACLRTRNFGEAIGPLTRLRRSERELPPEVEYQLASCLFEEKRYEEARILFQALMARSAHQDMPEVLRQLAVTLRRLRRDRDLSDQLLRLYIENASPEEAEEAAALLETP